MAPTQELIRRCQSESNSGNTRTRRCIYRASLVLISLIPRENKSKVEKNLVDLNFSYLSLRGQHRRDKGERDQYNTFELLMKQPEDMSRAIQLISGTGRERCVIDVICSEDSLKRRSNPSHGAILKRIHLKMTLLGNFTTKINKMRILKIACD